MSVHGCGRGAWIISIRFYSGLLVEVLVLLVFVPPLLRRLTPRAHLVEGSRRLIWLSITFLVNFVIVQGALALLMNALGSLAGMGLGGLFLFVEAGT